MVISRIAPWSSRSGFSEDQLTTSPHSDFSACHSTRFNATPKLTSESFNSACNAPSRVLPCTM